MNFLKFITILLLIGFSFQASAQEKKTDGITMMRGELCTDFDPKSNTWSKCVDQEFSMTKAALDGVEFNLYHTQSMSFSVSTYTKYPVALYFRHKGADVDYSENQIVMSSKIYFQDDGKANYQRELSSEFITVCSEKLMKFSTTFKNLGNNSYEEEGLWSRCGYSRKIVKVVTPKSIEIRRYTNSQFWPNDAYRLTIKD